MPSRDFDTGIWADRWFRGLKSVEQKLLFIYLWTNDGCTPAGVYEIDPDLVELQCGVSLDGNTQGLRPKVEYFPEHSVVWVKNFFRRQCKNRSFAYAAIKAVRKLPPEITAGWYEYNQKLLKSLGLNTQCQHGVITVSPTVPTQTSNKTRSDQVFKKGNTESIGNSQKPCQDCQRLFTPRYEDHERCDPCYRAFQGSAASKWIACPHCGSGRSDVKRGKPCPECGKTV